MGKRPAEETVARESEIIALQSASGMTVAAFCCAKSVAAPRFFAWRRRLSGSTAPANASYAKGSPAKFLPVAVDMQGRSAPRSRSLQGRRKRRRAHGRGGLRCLAGLLRAALPGVAISHAGADGRREW